MDMNPIKASTTGFGIQNDRKYVGHYYVNLVHGRLAHTAPSECDRGTEFQRVPVFELNGKLYFTNPYHEAGGLKNHRLYGICLACKGKAFQDMSWQDRAACKGINDEGFFDPAKEEHNRVIKEYCMKCPVARACLEYAMNEPASNVGSVWGGVYFTTASNRNATIRRRLDELTGVC